MTKKQFLKLIEKFPDDALIMVEGELCPVEVGSIDEGVQVTEAGKEQRLIIIEVPPTDF